MRWQTTLLANVEKWLRFHRRKYIAEESTNDIYYNGSAESPLGLRRYSYDYFAHPTEQSTRSIPYKELDKIAELIENLL